MIEGGETLPGDEESREQLASCIPIGQLGRPEEVEEGVHALVASPFVTAQTVSVDGGIHPANLPTPRLSQACGTSGEPIPGPDFSW